MEDLIQTILIIFVVFFGVVIVAAGIGLILAFPIKWCWNYVMPDLFNLKEITWGEAWCLNFLAGCLIKATQTNKNNKE